MPWNPTPDQLAQPVLEPPARSSIFLTVTIRPGAEQEARDFLPEVSGLVRTVAFRRPEDRLTCVVGIGAELWQRAFDDVPMPEGLHPFVALQGDKHSCPSTPGDLFFHLRSARFDMCFELARLLLDTLGDAVEHSEEVDAFRYFDDRDLLGFVDGTENPNGLEAAQSVVVADGPWTGASQLVVQKYVHDLTAWNAISTAEQERVIGRTKLDDVEMDDDTKPLNSHVAVNTIEDADGTEHKIVRDNLAFGSPSSGEFGTYFIGYAADVSVTERMLERMFLGEPRGNYDRILDFSTALTGCNFFVPPLAFLEDPDSFAGPGSSEQGQQEDEPTPHDGSLGIGSLKG